MNAPFIWSGPGKAGPTASARPGRDFAGPLNTRGSRSPGLWLQPTQPISTSGSVYRYSILLEGPNVIIEMFRSRCLNS